MLPFPSSYGATSPAQRRWSDDDRWKNVPNKVMRPSARGDRYRAAVAVARPPTRQPSLGSSGGRRQRAVLIAFVVTDHRGFFRDGLKGRIVVRKAPPTLDKYCGRPIGLRLGWSSSRLGDVRAAAFPPVRE
uniref:Uncharacterized protein n=1 Tax=Plectus sambesii TaxID=2011161 RepID=A0A914UPW6_9BILA